MGDIAQRGNRLTFAKGGRAGYAIGGALKAAKWAVKKFRKPKPPHRDKPPSKTHKDVPTMAAKGGRIGLKKGSVHKPGSHSYFLHEIHKPRKGKAIGGIAKGIGALAKKFKKKKVYPETEDLTHQVGPYVGDVGSERPGIKKKTRNKKKRLEKT